ncbi:restriction endonuclease subunit S [Halococcus salifodinae]|uniref:Restriction modification system DNA specificity subunit n=1 Tax=Halococcus salifodinae DSM 8989 TaxID=1227456 RepID=M0MWL9_9EURY|nr:restriction endonuclease subunit S [Halococcus salifodinae]EMA48835.1 restriction modification system DNA specificity subunit [Halococcus salifodinae DSM 8989]
MSRTSEEASIEKIPTSFPTTRLKFGVERRTDKFDTVPEEVPRVSLDMVESWTGNVVENSEEDAEASAGLVRFHAGDVCFSKLRPYLAKAFEAEHFGAASPEFLVFRPTQFDARFLRYLLLSREFIERVDASTYGAKMPRASWNFIGDMLVPCPNERVQEEVADFLDHRTARIDALVAKQKRLLDLFRERRNSIVSTAVCRGVKSERSLKPSGIDGVGNIPGNWDTRKLKWLLKKSPKNGISPPIASESEGIPTFSISTVGNGEVSVMDDLKYADVSEEKARNYSINEGDVLMIRGNGNPELVGKCGIVTPPVPEDCIYPDILISIKFRPQLSAKFFVYLLNSPPIRPQIEVGAKTSTGLWKISQNTISNIRVPCPPVEEQQEIVESIDSASSELDHLTQKTQRSIDLLEEKRQALITAAVTGQIDVTEERGETHATHR